MASRPHLHLLAGWASSLVALLAAVLALPVFLRVLGAQGYAVIGFYFTLQALLQGLDTGLTATAGREVAAAAAAGQGARRRRLADLLTTLAWIAGAAGLVLGLLLVLAAPWVTRRWLGLPPGSGEDLPTALRLMGLALAVRWPAGLPMSVLLGAGRQATVSAVNILATVLAYGGGALALAWGGPRLAPFFAVQVLAAAVQALCLYRAARALGLGRADGRPRFASLRRIRRFALGMAGFALAALAVASMDRLILPGILSLGDYGHYLLAATVAAVAHALANPVHNWCHPRLGRLWVAQRGEAVDFYRQVSHLLACLLAGLVIVWWVGGPALLRLWTGDPALARAVAPALGWLGLGCAFQALATFPLGLSLAAGAASQVLRANLAALLAFPVLVLLLGRAGGMVGAAFAFAACHGLYLLAGAGWVHRRLAPGLHRSWLLRDLGPPLALALALGAAGRWLLGALGLPASDLDDALAALVLCALHAAVLAGGSPRVRALLARRRGRSLSCAQPAAPPPADPS